MKITTIMMRGGGGILLQPSVEKQKKKVNTPQKCDDTSECAINHSLPFFTLFPLEGRREQVPDDEGVNTARFSGHDCTPWEEKQSVRTIIQDKMPSFPLI